MPAERIVQDETHQARQEGPDRRPEMGPHGQAVEEVDHAVKGPRIERGQHDHEEHQEQVGPQPPGIVEDEIRRVEKRFPARVKAVGAVGDDTGDGGGHDDFGLEFRRAVKHLGGEQGAGQRGAEDGGNARAHAGRHQDAAIGDAQPQEVGQERTEAGPDLRDGPFAAAGAARADGDRAGDDLDQRHPRPDLPLLAMIGVDHAVGSVPFRLGGEGEHQETADQTAHRGNDQQQPRAKRRVPDGQPGQFGLSGGTHRLVVAHDRSQGVVFDDPSGKIEDDGPQTGHDAHQDGQAQQSGLRANPATGQKKKLREPTEPAQEICHNRGRASFSRAT